METKKEFKYFFEMFDQLIPENDIFLHNKIKLYCEYVLSLSKEYVGRFNDNLYDMSENYLNKRNNKMEDIEKEIKLGIEAIDICKEILKYIEEKDLMKIYKAKVYCEYFLSHLPVHLKTTELEKRSKKYLENLDNFERNYKYVLKDDIDNE